MFESNKQKETLLRCTDTTSNNEYISTTKNDILFIDNIENIIIAEESRINPFRDLNKIKDKIDEFLNTEYK